MKKLNIKPVLLITLLFGAFVTIFSCKKNEAVLSPDEIRFLSTSFKTQVSQNSIYVIRFMDDGTIIGFLSDNYGDINTISGIKKGTYSGRYPNLTNINFLYLNSNNIKIEKDESSFYFFDRDKKYVKGSGPFYLNNKTYNWD